MIKPHPPEKVQIFFTGVENMVICEILPSKDDNEFQIYK